MINIHDDLISELDDSETYLMLHLAKRMRANKMMAWPSVKTLCEDTKWEERKVRRVKQRLVEKGVIYVEKRTTENGNRTSDLYKCNTDKIGVFMTLQVNNDSTPQKGEGDTPQKGEGDTPQKGEFNIINNLSLLTSEGGTPPEKNDSVNTENQTEEIIPPGAAELQTFAGLKKAMRTILEDTPANRIQALKFYEVHILGDYFMSSWEYLSDGMPISPQRVIKEWIMKGGWYQITECQYNKIGNWIKTEFKILNEKNEKSGKQPIITMEELYDIDARLAADGY